MALVAAPHNQRVSKALRGYRELSEVLPLMTEEEIRTLLELENASLRRPVVLTRAVQRLVKVITDRERELLEKRYTPWAVSNPLSKNSI